jgi:hypothetical protein
METKWFLGTISIQPSTIEPREGMAMKFADSNSGSSQLRRGWLEAKFEHKQHVFT